MSHAAQKTQPFCDAVAVLADVIFCGFGVQREKHVNVAELGEDVASVAEFGYFNDNRVFELLYRESRIFNAFEWGDTHPGHVSARKLISAALNRFVRGALLSITQEILEAFLDCPTTAYLKSRSAVWSDPAFAQWQQGSRCEFRRKKERRKAGLGSVPLSTLPSRTRGCHYRNVRLSPDFIGPSGHGEGLIRRSRPQFAGESGRGPHYEPDNVGCAETGEMFA